jgi:hypothetical protein
MTFQGKFLCGLGALCGEDILDSYRGDRREENPIFSQRTPRTQR